MKYTILILCASSFVLSGYALGAFYDHNWTGAFTALTTIAVLNTAAILLKEL